MNNKGMAMLITLAIITLLITGALELNRRVRAAVVATAAARDRLILSEMAASGVQAMMAMLIKDKKTSGVDSIQEDWANPEKIGEVLQAIPFEKGRVGVQVQDELGKIQVNALVDFPKGRHFNESQKIMWDRFTRNLLARDEEAFEGIEAPAIINSVKDWLDSGDDDAITGLSGAEDDYYQGLDPPYSPANGPFTHVEELMRVKDITPELFAGAEGLGGIENFMTVYGMTLSQTTVDHRNYAFEGKININTAPLPVLIAMVPSENSDYAQSIYDYRGEKNEEGDYIHDLSSPTWYKNAPDIPSDLTIDPRLITVSSDFFRIRATAELDSMKMAATAIVHREQAPKTGKWMCRILNWRTE